MDDHQDGGGTRPTGTTPPPAAPAGAGPDPGTDAPDAAATSDGVPDGATVELPATGPVRIVGAQPAVEALQGAEPPAPPAPVPPAVPDLPPWTDPPTGQVPAVLDRGGADEDDPWTAVLGTPGWREHPHEWEDPTYEPSLLGDDTTRVGSMGPGPDDDLDVPAWASGAAAPGAGAPAVAPAGTGPAADEPVDEPVDAPHRAHRRRAGGRRGAAGPGGSGPGGGHQPAAGGTPAPGVAGAWRAPARSGRNLPVAIGTGLGVAAVALVCFALGPLASLILAAVVVVACAAEVYGTLQRAGHRPATLVGLVGTAGLMGAAYAKGLPAVALVTMLVVVVTMLWYLFGLGRGPAVGGIGATLTVYLWVGLLGSFAALLVAPSLYSDRHGVAFLLGAVAAVVAADVGALAVGAWLGRHRMAPTISPNKTWEGWAGGAALSILVSALLTGQMHPWTPGTGAVLGAVVAVVAPLGDLSESLVKRELGLKDMGSFLPGHGGLVDRFDALLFALPATFYLVRLLNLG